MRPLAIDLFCGLGGWSDGLLAEGWDVIGFDIEQHVYGEHRYPAQLVIQDVRTLHGSQFRNADLIVASPPCQEYSYMAMPWTRAKEKAKAIREDTRGEARAKLNELFDACFRIQREACAAAGRHIPMVVENVRGAQPWVGRAKWNYGSYYLWGDVPALMPQTLNSAKAPGHSMNKGEPKWNMHHTETVDAIIGLKNPGFRFDGSGRSFQSESVDRHVKNGNDWFGSGENCSLQRRANSKSPARKFASAMIAKIPLTLSRHIGRCFMPMQAAA